MRTARAIACAVMLAGLGACSRSNDAALAARGEIDPAAPVSAHASLVIDAPPEIVWALLSDIDHWPDWQPGIDRASILLPAHGPAAAGARFDWSTGHVTIHSRIALLVPRERLAWTGRMLVFRAVHCWRLIALANGATLVTTDESLSGWPVAWLISRQALTGTDQDWLDALRRAALSRKTALTARRRTG